MEPVSTGIKPWQWAVTAVVVIVIVVLSVWMFSGKSSTPTAATDAGAAATTGGSQGQANVANSVIVPDQYPGNVVYLTTVSLAKPGWVVIYTNTAGRLGDVIGQGYFPAGISPGNINLTKPMIDSGSYFAVLISDNGDKKFDLKTDLPIKDANGNVIMKPFRALSDVGNGVKG